MCSRSLSLSCLFLLSTFTFFPRQLSSTSVVLLHAGIGIVAAVFLIPRLLDIFRRSSIKKDAAWLLIALGAGTGISLLITGTPRPHWNLMYAHIAISLAGAAFLAARWVGSKGWLASGTGAAFLRYGVCLALAATVGIEGWHFRQSRWQNANRINNPISSPVSMEGEGDGPKGPFFPSSAQTAHKGQIPSKYFMESDACERCHSDIFKQWNSSMHHFSSFNNQWYRNSIEYMQDVVGVKPSKWCAGCHDPALLYSGMFDTPIKQIVDRPEARAAAFPGSGPDRSTIRPNLSSAPIVTCRT